MARGLVEFAVAEGADRTALMAAAKLDPAALCNDDGRVPFFCYAALYTAAEKLTRDPAFALHFGESMSGMDLLVCHVGGASETMAGALASINRYGRLAVDVETQVGGDSFRIEKSSEGIWLIDASIYPGDVPQLTETSFTRLVSGTREVSDREFVRTVHFVRRKPPFAAEYGRIFRAPVFFGRRRNAMLMDPEWLSLSIGGASSYAASVIETHANRLLRDLSPAMRCTRRVEEVMTRRLASGPGMAVVAHEMGMSRQTLYRHLKAEGTTFERVADQLRSELALELLGDGRTVKEIAERLGFSDRSAFSRAFKRWRGTSPRSITAM